MSYVAFVFAADGRLDDIYAANNLITLTSMVQARGLAAGETVRYRREYIL